MNWPPRPDLHRQWPDSKSGASANSATGQSKWSQSPVLPRAGYAYDALLSAGPTAWCGIRVARPVIRFGRPACIYQHLCREIGSRGRFRPSNHPGNNRPLHC